MPEDWDEAELVLAILQVLLAARKKRPQCGGASGRMLLDCLNADIDQLQHTIEWLLDQKLVEAGEHLFLITATGVDYVEEHLPPFDPPTSPPAGQDPPPWSPGDPPGPWPPKKDPDDPSRVPLRRKPSGSAGERALPLPNPQDL